MADMPLSYLTKRRPALDNGGVAFRRPPFFRRARKLALLGNTASLVYAPWTDETWLMAAHPCCRPRCKREPDWYFDMHIPICFQQPKMWNPTYYLWLKHLQAPIFMQEHWPEIPMSVRYPLELVEAEFATSVTGDLFATNHCAYMIALAMKEGVETIGLFGCQYAGNERGTQRESLLYWMGRFEQAGGRLVVPRRHNTLMTQPLYGYASHDEHGKLIDAYRVHPAPAKTPVQDVIEKKTGAATQEPVPLMDPSMVPLMAPPEGESIAYERAREMFPTMVPLTVGA